MLPVLDVCVEGGRLEVRGVSDGNAVKIGLLTIRVSELLSWPINVSSPKLFGRDIPICRCGLALLALGDDCDGGPNLDLGEIRGVAK